MKQSSREAGFTVIELIIFFVVMTTLAVFFVLQRMDLETSFDDQYRKTAINSIFYSLTEVYHKEKGFYPTKITEDMINGIDPDMLYDMNGIVIGDSDSEYRYEGLNCDKDNHCKEFRLTAKLEKEDDYVLESSDD